MQFPTWTLYGDQDDLDPLYLTSSFSAGTNLGNGTWKYRVNIADHNNEAGKYITHFYIFGKDTISFAIDPVLIETDNYIGSIYLSETDANFINNGQYVLYPNRIYANFTYEFDAKPNDEIMMYSLGESANYTDVRFNYIIYEGHGGDSNIAGIGLAIGTNGAIAIAHRTDYYYVLLSYAGDLSVQHRYRFTVKNNIPYLYIDGSLVSSGIEPFSPVDKLFSANIILAGSYGSYKGYANNFVLYNNAR